MGALARVGAAVGLLVVLAGCSTTRRYTITTQPPDATIIVDGMEVGRGEVTKEIKFKGKDDVHTVAASRLGFREQTVSLTKDRKDPQIHIALGPQVRRVTVRIAPVPANVLLDGKPASPEMVSSFTRELEFTVDAKNNWIPHTVRIERPGWAAAEQAVNWTDPVNSYDLTLGPLRKDVAIHSEPPGAAAKLGGREVGVTPTTVPQHPFPVDPVTGEFVPQELILSKPGYDAVRTTITWDEGGGNYMVRIPPRSKAVRFITDPPGATVTIDAKALQRDADGVSMAEFPFPPVDEAGTLRTYTALVTRKTADSEWFPEEVTVGWDKGQTDYRVALREVLTRPVALLEPRMQRTDEGWRVMAQRRETLAMKDVSEGSQRNPATQLTRQPAGTVIDSLSISPDGAQIVYTILQSTGGDEMRSQIMVMRSDASGGAQMYTDGRSLDIMPSFTGGGDQIVFASNRGGRELAIWSISAVGAPGITQLTTGDTNDLWPTIDADPRPRLYYEAYVDTRPDSRLYMTQLGTTIRTDLTHISGSQPRVSPKADAVIFTAANSQTGKRDLYRMSDKGGEPQNLTSTPDIDEFDPVWNRDGSKIAFAADRGNDPETGRNYDIWMLDMARPERPVQITTNGSWDDSPAFDPTDNFVYFRSNRGGDWNIWKAPTP